MGGPQGPSRGVAMVQYCTNPTSVYTCMCIDKLRQDILKYKYVHVPFFSWLFGKKELHFGRPRKLGGFFFLLHIHWVAIASFRKSCFLPHQLHVGRFKESGKSLCTSKMWGCNKCMGNKYTALGKFVFMSNTGAYPLLDCSK